MASSYSILTTSSSLFTPLSRAPSLLPISTNELSSKEASNTPAASAPDAAGCDLLFSNRENNLLRLFGPVV